MNQVLVRIEIANMHLLFLPSIISYPAQISQSGIEDEDLRKAVVVVIIL